MGDNLAPIIEELRKAYLGLLPHFKSCYAEQYGSINGRWSPIPPEKQVLKMPMPIITVQRRGRSKADGWYKTKAWHSDSAEAMNLLAGKEAKAASTDEIGIAAESLNRPTEQIVITLAGQMVHHMAVHNQKGRTQNSNGYQTDLYRRYLQEGGLEANRAGGRGWEAGGIRSGTKGKQLQEAIANLGINDEVFDMFRNEELTREFKGSKLKKWSCKCTNLRAAVYIEATCLLCGEDFEYVDKDADSMKPHLDFEAKRIEGLRRYKGTKHPGRK